MNNQDEVIVGYCDLCRSYERANYGEAAQSVDFLDGSPSIKDQEEFYTQVEREEASQGAVLKNDKSLNRREKKLQRKLSTNQK